MGERAADRIHQRHTGSRGKAMVGDPDRVDDRLVLVTVVRLSVLVIARSASFVNPKS